MPSNNSNRCHCCACVRMYKSARSCMLLLMKYWHLFRSFLCEYKTCTSWACILRVSEKHKQRQERKNRGNLGLKSIELKEMRRKSNFQGQRGWEQKSVLRERVLAASSCPCAEFMSTKIRDRFRLLRGGKWKESKKDPRMALEQGECAAFQT